MGRWRVSEPFLFALLTHFLLCCIVLCQAACRRRPLPWLAVRQPLPRWMPPAPAHCVLASSVLLSLAWATTYHQGQIVPHRMTGTCVLDRCQTRCDPILQPLFSVVATITSAFHCCRDVLLIAVGSRPALDPLGPYTVDYQGTVNLITAAQAAGVKKVELKIGFIGVCHIRILQSQAGGK